METCIARVYHGSAWRGTRCTKPATCIRKVSESVKVEAARIDTSAVYEGGEPERIDARFEEQLVERPFCSTHDPERVRVREEKKQREHDAERKRVLDDDTRCRSMAEESARKLKEHFGVEVSIEYQRKEWGPNKNRHYPTGRVTLSAQGVDKIIARLSELAVEMK